MPCRERGASDSGAATAGYKRQWADNDLLHHRQHNPRILIRENVILGGFQSPQRLQRPVAGYRVRRRGAAA